MTLEIIIVRHGRTRENSLKIVQGQLDTELDDEGVAQSIRLGKYLRSQNLTIDHIYTSDLKRCSYTADLVANQLETKPPIEPMTGLREKDMGSVQGMVWEDALKMAAREGRSMRSYYAETPKETALRVSSAFDALVAKSLEADHKRIMIMSHGGAIGSLTNELVNGRGFVLSRDIPENSIKAPRNTSTTIVHLDRADPSLGKFLTFSNTDHLLHSEAAHEAL